MPMAASTSALRRLASAKRIAQGSEARRLLDGLARVSTSVKIVRPTKIRAPNEAAIPIQGWKRKQMPR